MIGSITILIAFGSCKALEAFYLGVHSVSRRLALELFVLYPILHSESFI